MPLLLADGSAAQRLQSGQLLQLLPVDPVCLLEDRAWGGRVDHGQAREVSDGSYNGPTIKDVVLKISTATE